MTTLPQRDSFMEIRANGFGLPVGFITGMEFLTLLEMNADNKPALLHLSRLLVDFELNDCAAGENDGDLADDIERLASNPDKVRSLVAGLRHRASLNGRELVFNGMTVSQGADHVMKQVKPSWIIYAKSPARGEYAGFAALHDKCDANMLLPFTDDASWPITHEGEGNEETQLQAYLDFCIDVMDEVKRRILSM